MPLPDDPALDLLLSVASLNLTEADLDHIRLADLDFEESDV